MRIRSTLLFGMAVATGFVIGIAASLGVASFPGPDEAGASRGERADPRATDGAPIQRAAVVARGLVDADGGLIQIAASRDGVVRMVAVEEGDRVHQGDVLLVVDDRTARSDLAVAEAELAQAKAALQAISVRKAAAERDVARYRRLVAASAVAQARLDEDLDRLRLAAADLVLQEAIIATASARRDAAATEVAERTVRAPLDGVVVRRQVRPGDGISTLNVTTLFWLAPASPIIVRAEIEELSAERVSVGQQAEVVVEDDTVRRYSAAVARLSLAFVPRRATLYDPRDRVDVRVVEAVVRFVTPPPLRLGQRVIVRFPDDGSLAPAS
jgi:multidrug efflux pump subunit AcrA (membrane-fusion protein)